MLMNYLVMNRVIPEHAKIKQKVRNRIEKQNLTKATCKNRTQMVIKSDLGQIELNRSMFTRT